MAFSKEKERVWVNMKIYLAGVEDFNLEFKIVNTLLSYYDIGLSTIPFRKQTFEMIKEKHESLSGGKQSFGKQTSKENN